jgi:hypothetical protein
MSIALALLLLSVLCLIIGLIGLLDPRRVHLRGEPTRKNVAKTYLGGSAMFMVIFAACMASRIPLAVETVDVATAAPAGRPDGLINQRLGNMREVYVEAVELVGDGSYHVTVKYSPKSVWDGAHFISSLAFKVQDVGKAVQEDHLLVSSLTVNAWRPTKDRYGNPSSAQALTAELDANTFQKINWKNALSFDILDLMKVHFLQFGLKDSLEYCNEGDNAREADDFCTNVGRRAGSEAIG